MPDSEEREPEIYRQLKGASQEDVLAGAGLGAPFSQEDINNILASDAGNDMSASSAFLNDIGYDAGTPNDSGYDGADAGGYDGGSSDAGGYDGGGADAGADGSVV